MSSTNKQKYFYHKRYLKFFFLSNKQYFLIGSVLLAGILLKLGVYGFLRFSLTMFPEASYFFAPIVYVFCGIGIIYTSFAAIRQTDLKRIIAYSSVAHMNLITLGLFSFNSFGLEGALLQSISHGFVASALFFLIGMIYRRYQTRFIYYYGGVTQVMPLFSFFFLFFTLANIALPGTSSFVGEFLILIGLFLYNIKLMILASLRQIIGEDIKAGKLKLDAKILNEKDPVEILRTHYGEDVLEQLDSLTPDFNQMYDAKEAADFARKKYPLTPLEKPVKGSVTYDELEKEFYKNEFKQAMQEGVKDSNRMIELGLDPSKSKDYDKFLKMEEIKQKYGTAISDDLLQKIMIDDNPQRQAEVLAAIDEAIKMQEKGLSPDEIIDIMTNTPRTKQAKGGIAGLGNI